MVIAERNCVNIRRSLEKLSTTPRTARKDEYMAWYVDSNIILTDEKALTRDSTDWKAPREFSSAAWRNLETHHRFDKFSMFLNNLKGRFWFCVTPLIL